MPGDGLTHLLRASDVAERLGVSPAWIIAAAAHGRIPSFCLGGPEGPLRFAPADVEAWLQRNRYAAGPVDRHEHVGQQRRSGVEPSDAFASTSLSYLPVDHTSGETFAEAARRWLARKERLIERSTYEDYRRHLAMRLLPVFGPLRLAQISRKHIEDYVTGLDRAGLISPKTINDSLIPLRQILARGVRDGALPANVALSPDRDDPLELPYERPVLRCLSRGEARRYLDAATREYRHCSAPFGRRTEEQASSSGRQWRQMRATIGDASRPVPRCQAPGRSSAAGAT